MTTTTPMLPPVITDVFDPNTTLRPRTPDEGGTTATLLMIQGTAEPDTRVEIFDGARSLGMVTTDADWHWMLSMPNLDSGQHTFTAKATYLDGSASTDSPLAYHCNLGTTDISVYAPTITSLTDNVGMIDMANQGPTYDPTPTIHGDGQPGTIVKIYADALPSWPTPVLGSTQVDADGHWSFTTPELGPSTHYFSTLAVTPDGLASAEGPQSTAGIITDGSDVPAIAVTSDFLFSGIPTQPVGCTIVDPREPSRIPLSVIDRDLTLTAVIDHVGPIQGALNTAFTAPGVNATPFFTDDTQPTLEGNGVPGSTVVVRLTDRSNNTEPTLEVNSAPDSTVAIGLTDMSVIRESAIVDAQGHWSITPQNPLDVYISYNLDITESSSSDPSNIIGHIDTSNPYGSLLGRIEVVNDFTRPETIAINSINDNSDQIQGKIQTNGGYTENSTPIISGMVTLGSYADWIYNFEIYGAWIDEKGVPEYINMGSANFDHSHRYFSVTPTTPIDVPAGTMIHLIAAVGPASRPVFPETIDLHSSFIFGPDPAAPSTALDTLLTHAGLPAQASPTAPTAVAADVATPTVHTAAHVWQTAAVHDLAY